MTDVINNKIKLINKIGETIDNARCVINNETNMINEIIDKATVVHNDTLYLTDHKPDKIITQTRKKIKITPKNKTIPKNKYRDKTMTMLNNKKNLINKINIRLSKAKTKVSNNIKSI